MKGLKQIKNYRLLRQIGKGSTGTVYEAVDDANSGKRYAVKSISADKINNGYILESFKRELNVLHKLNQQNIIKIFGVEKTVNNIYLILEFANGGTLLDYLLYHKSVFGTPLPESTVQFIIRQVAKGLESMHKLNIVHRDIKLENILIHFPHITDKVDFRTARIEESIIKIADLGYAKELSNDLGRTICGTPLTMAPDIIGLHSNFNNGKNSKALTYNTKVDLWSLGAVTYELIFGTPPFNGQNYQDLFQEVMNGKYFLPNYISISLEAVTFLNGLLQFYQEKRLTWEAINSHAFIKEKFKTFHFMDLEQVNTGKFELDSKDLNNFLWVLYKPKKVDVKIDKIDDNIFLDEKILTEIAYVDINKDENQQVDKKEEINIQPNSNINNDEDKIIENNRIEEESFENINIDSIDKKVSTDKNKVNSQNGEGEINDNSESKPIDLMNVKKHNSESENENEKNLLSDKEQSSDINKPQSPLDNNNKDKPSDRNGDPNEELQSNNDNLDLLMQNNENNKNDEDNEFDDWENISIKSINFYEVDEIEFTVGELRPYHIDEKYFID